MTEVWPAGAASMDVISTVVNRVVTKAVIPAARFGKRLNPITNGFADVAIVINPRKRVIQEYLMNFCPHLAMVCRLSFLMQPEPYGLGHALLLARDFCDGNPFFCRMI
jgi:UTP-glucose-1-phosphate uridylyltransferase